MADVGAGTVARSDAKTSGNNLVLGTGIVVGSTNIPITGLERYGSPEVLWVLKEDSQWAVQNDIPDQIPLREMASVRSDKNGRAHLVHGVYLYFSLLHSLQRYFRNNLDDVGPSQDFGLPADRQGPIVDMVGYPGVFFCAVDAGPAYFSSILMTSGSRVGSSAPDERTISPPSEGHATDPSAGEVDSIADEPAVALGDIAPGAEGRAELRGTSWAAKNIGDGPLTEGQKCTVDRVDGLKLYVR